MRKKNSSVSGLSSEAEAWLRCDESGFFQFQSGDVLQSVWDENADRIVASHVSEFPGTRPARWWEFDSVEPRKRLGGVGTPDFEVLGIKPTFSLGIPTCWINQWQVDYYTGVARDVNGKLTNENPQGTFTGVAIDPDDAPLFESQATYLKRHGLLLTGEAKRLTKVDWEAEVVMA